MTPSRWKFDSGCPPKNCSATTAASPRPAAGGAADHQVGQQQQPGQQGPDVGQRPGEPRPGSTGRRRRPSPASSAPAKRMPSARAEQVGAEGRDEHLQSTPITPQRPPERQHVGGQAERREHAGLRVGEEGPPAADVRVPQRRVGQALARVLEPRLGLRRRVDELEVRAQELRTSAGRSTPTAPPTTGSRTPTACGRAAAPARTGRAPAARRRRPRQRPWRAHPGCSGAQPAVPARARAGAGRAPRRLRAAGTPRRS